MLGGQTALTPYTKTSSGFSIKKYKILRLSQYAESVVLVKTGDTSSQDQSMAILLLNNRGGLLHQTLAKNSGFTLYYNIDSDNSMCFYINADTPYPKINVTAFTQVGPYLDVMMEDATSVDFTQLQSVII